MSDTTEDVLNKSIQKISSMSIEEFAELIRPKHSFKKEDVERILKEIREKNIIDDEDLSYFPQKYKISPKEYINFCIYTETFFTNSSKEEFFEEEDNPFWNYSFIIIYEEEYYLSRTCVGQGTSRQFAHVFKEGTENYPKIELIIDENFKFKGID